MGLADFSTRLNIVQSNIKAPPYWIANINYVQVRKVKNSLKAEKYINSICPNDWVMFQVPE